MGHPLQLEIPRRKLLRRRLPRAVGPSFGDQEWVQFWCEHKAGGRRPYRLPGNGHAIVCVGPNDMTEPPMPEIIAYEHEIRPEVEKRLGARLGSVSPVVGTLFPNFSFLRVGSRCFRVWHPRGPDKTEVWSWVYVDKAAPPHIKEAVRLGGIRGFGPSGSFEQDDMDNWQECTRGCR